MSRCLTYLLATLLSLVFYPHAAVAVPPNIVLFFADDLGYGDIGCFGSKTNRTPNVDRIAAEGVKLADFYVAQAVCSASRAALLTGRYPNRVGILGALGPNATNGISDREFTLAEVCKSRGYATAIFGKWHLGHLPQFLPTRHGFDEYYGLPYSNDMWPNHPRKKDYPPLPLIENDKTIAIMPDQSKLTAEYTRRATAFIAKNHERPFFLYLPYTFPHVPLHVGAKFARQSPHGIYADVIEELDQSVGTILDELKRLGLDQNTLVIFTSDNGPWLPYGNHAGTTGGLREGKGTSFEGGVRVPCVARWPGRIPVGTVCAEPVMTIDLLPTIANAIGAQLPKDLQLDGRDISSLLTNSSAQSPHEVLYFYYGQQLQAVRSGRWKLHVPHPYVHLEQPGADGQPGRESTQKTELSLYDLVADRPESKNVAERNPDVLKRLLTHVEAARADLGDANAKQ